MLVDVFLNWSVNAHGPNGIRDVIAYGTTATEQPDIVGPEEAIIQGLYIVRELVESQCDIDIGLVDCGWQGEKQKQKNPRKVVYEFAMATPNWFAAMGLSAWTRKDRSPDVKPATNGDAWYLSRQRYKSRSLWVVDFDPNFFKHRSHGSYVIQPVNEDGDRAPGSVTLFGAKSTMHTEFAAQLNNELYEVDPTTGRSEFKRRGANHYFDTDVGNLVARSVLGGAAG